MSDVITLANEIAKYKEDIRKAIVGHGVECDTTVPLSQYSTKIGNIESTAEGGKIFYGKDTDDSLSQSTTSYSIPSVNYTTMGKGALSGYQNLEAVSLVNIRYMDNSGLANCSALKDVTAQNLEYVGPNSFLNCTSLESISLPSVKYVEGNAFYGDNILINVDLTEAEKVGANAFYSIGNDTYKNTSSSTTVSLSLPKVKNVGEYAFYDVYGLRSIDLPECESLGTYSLAHSSTSYNNMTSVNLPKVKAVGQYAFRYNSGLTELLMPECESLAEYSLQYCPKIVTLQIGNGCKISGALTLSSESQNTSANLYNLQKVIGAPSYIGNYAFVNSRNLNSIDCSSATSIGNYAFYNCTSLASIDCSSATSISDYAFFGCTSLASIDCSSATSIGDDAFYNCTSLASIDCSSATSIGTYAFFGCTSLASIDCSSATSIGKYTFINCTALKKVWIPSTCTTIGTNSLTGIDSCTLYTDATEKPSGWSSVPSNVVYGATHDDFLNA